MRLRTTLVLLVVVLLLGGVIVLFERRTDSTRERREQARRALQVTPEKVTYLRFEVTNLVAECAREDEQWMIVQPVRARADAGEMDRILTGLEELPRGEVITAAEQKERGLSPPAYGLDQPRARVTYGNNLRRRTLLVGRDAVLGGAVYIKDTESEDIVAAGTNLLAILPLTASDLRDRTLLPGSGPQVERLEIARPDGFIKLARTERVRWQIQQPVVGRASPIVVQNILEALFSLEVRDFVADEGADPVAYGLDDPPFRVSVWSGDPAAETTLLFGDTTEAGGVYVKRKSADPVYVVGTNILGVLRMSADEVREHRLLGVSSYDISYVRAEEGERAIELRKEGQRWKITEPKQWDADAQQVRRLLNAWVNASIIAFVDDGVTNLAALGFESPARTLLFARAAPGQPPPAREVAGGDPEAKVLVSAAAREPGRLLVKLEKEDTPYEILAVVQDSLSFDPLFYRDREVLSLDPAQVTRITLVRGKQEQAVERAVGDVFLPATNTVGSVDQERVRDLLMTVSHLRVAGWVADDPDSLSKYGLDAPRGSLTLGLKEASGVGRTILFGRKADQGVYAMLRGQDVVFVLDAEAADVLQGDLVTVGTSPEGGQVDGAVHEPSS